MAVSSPTSALVYTGNGSAITAYPVSFPFLLTSDIYVAVTTAGGVTTLLNAGVDYTLTPTPDSDGTYLGGSIVTAVGYDNTHTVTIFRQVPITQLTELPEAGPFPALSIERGYDKLTMIVQQLHRRILELEGNGDGGAVVVIPEAPAGTAGIGAQIFADAAARGNAAPLAIGQLGYQVDNKTFWAASGPGVGSWAPAIFANTPQRILARKTAGTGAYEDCTVEDLLAWIAGSTDGDVIYRAGGTWGRKSAGADVQEFTADGTWTKPTHAKWVEGYIVGGGGGGGSGRRGAAATQRYGGGGGCGAGFCYFCVPAASFGATVNVIVGMGGTGGAAKTADNLDGANGTNGVKSSFGTIEGAGGNAGQGGTAAAGNGGNPSGNACTFGFASSFLQSGGGTNGNTGSDSMAPGGGGGGGQITAANAPGAGGRGAHIYPVAAGGSTRYALGGTGGSAGVGDNGQDGVGTMPLGTGAGGGGAILTAAGGSGGNGGRAGGGGGGGAASVNGFASGAGGNGGSGYVIITSY